MASALIIRISKHGFTNILADGRVVLDPSRMAAQIVSGIGFIGGGVIFVRKDLVRGLTTRDHDMGDFGGRHGLRRRSADVGDRRYLRQFRGLRVSAA
jgi:hypothetical protein